MHVFALFNLKNYIFFLFHAVHSIYLFGMENLKRLSYSRYYFSDCIWFLILDTNI